MKTESIFKLLILTVPTILNATEEACPPTTVYSEVHKSYDREFNSDGSMKPQTYAFAQGTCWSKSEDTSLTALSFRDIGNILAESLAIKEYYPTPTPEKTDLLIMVHWGKTLPGDMGTSGRALDALGGTMSDILELNQDMQPGEVKVGDWRYGALDDSDSVLKQTMLLQGLGDEVREEAVEFNSKILGYHKKMNQLKSVQAANPHFSNDLTQMFYELEDPRYFVVLQAFDFQSLWKHKQKNLLWVTRFSIRAKKRTFDKELDNMARSAAQSFGDKSGIFLQLQTPGHVIIQDLEFIGTEE